MFLVKFGEQVKYAASRKGLPSIVEAMAADAKMSLDKVLVDCTYTEINTKANRSGDVTMDRPLSELVKVHCSLIQEVADETEE